jgi:hypothetical protein
MKPSIPSYGVNRRALLSTLAVLPSLVCAALFRLRVCTDRAAGRRAAIME